MNNNLFEEKVSTVLILSILMGLSFIVLVWLIVAPFLGYQMNISTTTQIILSVILVFDVLILLCFRVLKIGLTEEKLTFGFGIFKRNIFLKDIEKVEIGEYAFNNYWGYGIRFGRDRSQGYVPRGGKGVRIYLKDNKTTFFISSARAEELVSMLKSRI